MPIGAFLDSLPKLLYIAAHVAFLLVGLWAVRKASANKWRFASAFWLYVVSQIVFLGFFGGVITLKMGVLLEQTLIVIMVISIVTRKPNAA